MSWTDEEIGTQSQNSRAIFVPMRSASPHSSSASLFREAAETEHYSIEECLQIGQQSVVALDFFGHGKSFVISKIT
jgi:hypothetical protein